MIREDSPDLISGGGRARSKPPLRIYTGTRFTAPKVPAPRTFVASDDDEPQGSAFFPVSTTTTTTTTTTSGIPATITGAVPLGTEDGDEDEADGVATVDAPVFTTKYRALQDNSPFDNLDDFVEFTERHQPITGDLLDALENPSSPDFPIANYWLAQTRRVMPSEPLSIAPYIGKSAVLWEALGKALRVSTANRGEALAEFHWTTASGTADPTLKELQAWADQHTTARRNFDAKLSELRGREALPSPARNEAASTSRPKSFKSVEDAAKETIGRRLNTLSGILETRHGTVKTWLTKLAGDRGTKADRSLDRVADVLTTLNGDRVCVALLRRGREIGVFANLPDKNMGPDLQRLLQASRAVGKEATTQVDGLMRLIDERLRSSKKKPTVKSQRRARIRIRKALAYLREMERTEGRVKVVAYDGPRNAGGQLVEVHAEMQALALVRKKTPGAYQLGIGRVCCLKCYLVLTSAYPKVFNRQLATHMKVYPWPAPAMLTEQGVLVATLGKGMTEKEKRALRQADGRRALAAGVAYGGLPPRTGGKDPEHEFGDQTGYASSEGEGEGLPTPPVWPGPARDRNREGDPEEEGYADDGDGLIGTLEDEKRSYQDYDESLELDDELTYEEAQEERGESPSPETTSRVSTTSGVSTTSARTLTWPPPSSPLDSPSPVRPPVRTSRTTTTTTTTTTPAKPATGGTPRDDRTGGPAGGKPLTKKKSLSSRRKT
ncbi:hypothetical protein [Acrocarpospora corrugata]|uniref:hypothetical protein n=1 Tax=Acrocarpospora corrugata TaxID=35763 RepID=UPI0012D2CAC2|nr:hypothetical protein [Acrocarpospora corrugata]